MKNKNVFHMVGTVTYKVQMQSFDSHNEEFKSKVKNNTNFVGFPNPILSSYG